MTDSWEPGLVLRWGAETCPLSGIVGDPCRRGNRLVAAGHSVGGSQREGEVCQWCPIILKMASQVVLIGKESACQCRRHKRFRFNPWVGKVPWRRERQPSLTWRIPQTEEPGGLQSMGSQRVRHSWATEHSKERIIASTVLFFFWTFLWKVSVWCTFYH